MTTTKRAAKATAPRKTVGIVHGGERPPSLEPQKEWAGNWGCDIACVEGGTYAFENDVHARFKVRQIHIQDIVNKENILEGIDVLIMPGGSDVHYEVYGPGQFELWARKV